MILVHAIAHGNPGFSGLITKNPAHPLWRTLRGPQLLYELDELAEALPGLERFVPRAARIAEIGLGRNVELFDHLRHWAYRNVRRYQGRGLQGWNEWLSVCNSRALVRNGDFRLPLDGREVWHVARSVAKWTYRHFDVDASDRRFSERQARRGRAGMLARWGDNEDKPAQARLMAAAGMSVRAIAQELTVGKSTVARWLD